MRRALLVVAVLAAAAAAWWWHAPETLPGFAQRVVPRPASANPPLYKWRDDAGTWQVTDTAPADRAYETVVVDPATNVVPAYGSEEERDER